ncbi:DinB family protein [Propionibacteriaceae bacterium Y1700]|uniref:DinB family protein n=1 Tax=Microlunatus sp. Y1700 TaxID=3418487 RepID=UPI003DA72E51
MTTPQINWTEQLAEQITWHWDNQLRGRLEGLTDEEYFWEPTPGWNVRPRGAESSAGMQAGTGDFFIEFEFPQPEPAPLTTIAWRLGHIIVGVLEIRSHNHFDGPPAEYDTWPYAGSAAEALAQLDAAYDRWITGVRSLDAAALVEPCGPAEGPFGELPMAALVLHIHRELIHHGAEIALLRDLYAHRRDVDAG